MQMNMEDVLHGCFTISQKEIDSFALYAALTQRCGETACDTKNLCAFFLFQVCQISSMSIWNNEQMTGIKRTAF